MDEDVRIMKEWWEAHGVSLRYDILPPVWFVVRDHELLCGSFLYTMELLDGMGGMVAHTIVNPDRPIAGANAIPQMLESIKEYAISNNIKVLMGSTSSRLLSKLYEEAGYIAGDKNLTQYFLVPHGTGNT